MVSGITIFTIFFAGRSESEKRNLTSLTKMRDCVRLWFLTRPPRVVLLLGVTGSLIRRTIETIASPGIVGSFVERFRSNLALLSIMTAESLPKTVKLLDWERFRSHIIFEIWSPCYAAIRRLRFTGQQDGDKSQFADSRYRR